MLSTIHFNDQLAFDADKISDVATDRMLPAELVSINLPQTQMTPKPLFGIGHVLSEMPCVFELVWHAFLTPIPAFPLGGGRRKQCWA